MPTLKRIVLLGDSIRMGYEATVRLELADVAWVSSSQDNGQHTVNELMRLYEWVVVHQPDLVHINAGLWDMRHLVRGKPENIVPIEEYRRNVTRLIQTIKSETSAKVIWATTTPIIQDRTARTFKRNGGTGRNAADVELYNQAAVAAATECQTTINDLHTVVMQNGIGNMISDDGVHFTAAGSEVLGKAVAAKIRAEL